MSESEIINNIITGIVLMFAVVGIAWLAVSYTRLWRESKERNARYLREEREAFDKQDAQGTHDAEVIRSTKKPDRKLTEDEKTILYLFTGLVAGLVLYQLLRRRR